MMNKTEQESTMDDADGVPSSSEDHDVPVGRSFTMAHALSMLRKRNEQQQQTRQDEERQLRQERKDKAREKARRRRQNQKLVKAKQKEEAKSKSSPEKPSVTTSIEVTDTQTAANIDLNGIDNESTEKEASIESIEPKSTGESTSKQSLKVRNPLIPRALLLKKPPK